MLTRSWWKFALIAAVAAGTGAGAYAQGLAIGPRIGTLGPGLELTGYLTDNLNFRLSGNYVEFDLSAEVDDVDYDAEFRFASALATLDWFPLDNNFRISAALVLNDNKANLTGEVSDDVDFNGVSYTAAEVGTITGEAIFNKYVPYIGIGFGNPLWDDSKNDWSFMFDLGVIFQGSADIDLEADGTLAGDPTFQANLDEEEEDAQDVADDIQIYPVLSFGMAYYFW